MMRKGDGVCLWYSTVAMELFVAESRSELMHSPRSGMADWTEDSNSLSSTMFGAMRNLVGPLSSDSRHEVAEEVGVVGLSGLHW